MSMLRDDDDRNIENIRAKSGFIMGCVLASSGVILVLLLTFAVNRKSEVKNVPPVEQVNTVKQEENAGLSALEGERKRTSNELSFWNMYDEDKPDNTVVPSLRDKTGDDAVKEKFVPEKKDSASDNEVSENSAEAQKKERENAVSGNMFDVNELTEGTAELVPIQGGLPVNSRYEEGFEENGIWKDYALNGKKTSFRGIDVSSYQKNIDWEKVAASGVDFAMIRVGSRGYGSGKIVLDEKCAENMRGCSENGIKIGLYFQSQAVNMIEAVEEANYCLGAIGDFHLEYPVVFVSEAITNDSYRTENLSKEELSVVAKAFCDTVKAYGYTPMVGGDKKQIALHMDLRTIMDYDIWLFDSDDPSVFPYRYNMWRYSLNGEIEGIEDPADLNISFTDYSVK